MTPTILYKGYDSFELQGFGGNPRTVSYDELMDELLYLNEEQIELGIRITDIHNLEVKQIYFLLKAVESNVLVIQANVNWYCHDSNLECVELGKLFSETAKKCQFRFFPYQMNLS